MKYANKIQLTIPQKRQRLQYLNIQKILLPPQKSNIEISKYDKDKILL